MSSTVIHTQTHMHTQTHTHTDTYKHAQSLTCLWSLFAFWKKLSSSHSIPNVMKGLTTMSPQNPRRVVRSPSCNQQHLLSATSQVQESNFHLLITTYVIRGKVTFSKASVRLFTGVGGGGRSLGDRGYG